MSQALGELGNVKTDKFVEEVQENLSPDQLGDVEVVPEKHGDHRSAKIISHSNGDKTGHELVPPNEVRDAKDSARAAKFEGKTEEQKGKFEGKTEEQKAKFEGKTEENKAKFEGKTEENKGKFEGKTEENRGKFEGKTEENRGKFEGKTESSTGKFEGKTEGVTENNQK
ncbi:hypothetical protein OXX80_006205 [Metschnikowia pulcherrima]